MKIIGYILAFIILFASFYLVSIGAHAILGVPYTHASIAITILSALVVSALITALGSGAK